MQSLVPSPKWKETNITLSREERIGIAANALDIAVSKLDSELTLPDGQGRGIWNAATLHLQLSMFDRISNQTRYREPVTKYFDRRGSLGIGGLSNLPNFTNVNYFLFYASAAYQTSLTYNNGTLLSISNSAWEYARNQTISEATQNHFKRMFTCTDDDLWYWYGGLLDGYGVHQHDTLQFRPYANALYFKVSASLADSIRDTTHLQAAEESFEFVQSLLFDNLMVPTNWSKACDGAQAGDQDPKATGIAIEGISVLAKTKENATVEEQLIRNLTSASITGPADRLEGPWVSDSGVIDDEAPGEFVYNLFSAYQHQGMLPDVHIYLEKFLSIQYNAILTQARLPNSNMYGKWTGPPATTFQVQYQLSACYGLIAAIGLPEISGVDTSTTTTSSEPTNTDASGTSDRHDGGVSTGGVVGGVIGALSVVVLLVLGLIYWRRRRRRTVVPSQEASTSPFTLSATDVEPKSGGIKGRAAVTDRHATQVISPIPLHSPRAASLQEQLEPEPEMSRVSPGVQHAVDDIGEEERHQDSGWRPGHRGLPPTYEDAL